MTARKRMQRERKEKLEELRPPGERPWTTGRASSYRPQGGAGASDLFEGFAMNGEGRGGLLHERRIPSMNDRGEMARRESQRQVSKKPVVHIHKFHRDLVRREVMLQKFNFLYRQVCNEVEDTAWPATSPDASPRSRPESAAGRSASAPRLERAGRRCATAPGGKREAMLSSPFVSGCNFNNSTYSSTRLDGAAPPSELATAASQQRQSTAWTRKEKRHGSKTAQRPPEARHQLARGGAQPSPSTSGSLAAGSLVGGGSLAGGGSASSLAGAMARPSTAPQTSGAAAGSCRASVAAVATFSTPALLASASVPTLAKFQDLEGIMQSYYGGDELTMHEDILHCSNPRLFPLRAGLSKPFPLPNLVASN